ncbi:MAG: hypothetical protein HFI75_02340 [Lachnospiraceae bacterium]|nr:hypothetical protein [Lachnospiraceae bacterium]
MQGVEIRNISEMNDRDSKQSITALVFLLTGVYGIILFLHSLEGITFTGWIYLLTACFAWMVWYTFYYKRRWFYCILVLTVLCTGIAVWWQPVLFLEQMGQLAKSITKEAGSVTTSVSELVLLLSVLLSFIVFIFEFIIHNHILLYMLTTELLLLPPLTGIQTHMGVIVLLVLFQLAFWTVHTMGTERGRLQLSGIKKHRLSAKSSMSMGAIIIVAFLAAFPIVFYFSEEFYHSVYEIEGYVSRALDHLTGRAGNLMANGEISRGNNYKTNTAQLELVISEKPKENIYLRGFSGGDYIGGSWTAANDKELFQNMSSKLGWKDWYEEIDEMYESMYFFINNEMELPIEYNTLSIQHSSGNYRTIYVPYYSQRMYDDKGQQDSQMEGYQYRYYEQSDVRIDWGKLPRKRYRYRQLERAYHSETLSAYTWVPENTLTKLVELVENNPLEDLNEITTFILYTLHSNAEYTLTPGWVPFNQDVVEYFLFESGKGYCEHFAAAATLLYRLYGIPARYASGYMVSPSAQFQIEEDGFYHLTVTDISAHAWTEIFMEGYGWTPVEVTPAADGSEAAAYPGYSGNEYKQIMEAHGWNVKIPSLNEKTELNAGNEGQKNWYEWFKGMISEEGRLFWLIKIIIVPVLCLTPVLLEYVRLCRVKELQKMGCRRVFMRFMQMLHYGGYLTNYDGTEREFARKLAEEIGPLTEEKARQMQELVSEVAYGCLKPDSEMNAFVREIYVSTVEYVYKNLKWYKKILFWYCKAYG